MTAIVAAYLFLLLNQAESSNPRNVDVPILSIALETRDGSSVLMRFPAFYWGPDPIQDSERMAELISTRMGILENNVQIKIGATTLDPGRYYAGFEIITPELWDFIISTDTSEWVRVSIPMMMQEEYIPFLAFSFSPGVTDKDFLVNAKMGNFETTMRWVMTGVASQVLEPSAFVAGDSEVEFVDEEEDSAPRAIQSATELLTSERPQGPIPTDPDAVVATPTPTPQTKAGSGAFRHYKNEKEESED